MKLVLSALHLMLGMSLLSGVAHSREITVDDSRRFIAHQSQVSPYMVTFDPKRVKLRILSVPTETGASESTLSDLVRHLRIKKTMRAAEWAVINGGLSSYRTDVPLGLLIVDGKAYGTLSQEKVSANQQPSPTTASQFGGLRWSGILCQHTSNGDWRIVPASSYQSGLCRQAIQSGPVLVEPNGKVGINDGESTRSLAYVRSAVCILPDGRVRFVVAAQPTYLFPFAVWLAKSASEGGAGCQSALNLSGDTSSGMYVNLGRDQPVKQVIGPGSFPLPSALIVE